MKIATSLLSCKVQDARQALLKQQNLSCKISSQTQRPNFSEWLCNTMQDLGHTEGNTHSQRTLVESQFRLRSPQHFSLVRSALSYRVLHYHHHRTGELKLFCIQNALLCWRMLSFAGVPATVEKFCLHSAEQITLCKCYCYHRLKKV